MLNAVYAVRHSFFSSFTWVFALVVFPFFSKAEPSTSLPTSNAIEVNEPQSTAVLTQNEQSYLPQNWRVHGFGTVGYADTGKYDNSILRRNVYQNTEEIKKHGYKLDSRIGLQATGELSPRWSWVLQGVLKHQFINDVTDYIDVAMLRYQPNDEWQISVGRQPFDLFFLSDHRNVGYSYDWVRPPTEFYGVIPYDYFDGAKFVHRWGDFDNAWTLSFSIGFIEDSYEIISFGEHSARNRDASDNDDEIGSQDNNEDNSRRPDFDDVVRAEPIYNTELTWRVGRWHLRANYAYLDYEQELDSGEIDDTLGEVDDVWPGLNDFFEEFSLKDELHYYALGASWEHEGWAVRSEISHADAGGLNFSGQRGYLHVRKRWQNWSPFITLGYANDSASISYQRLEQTDITMDSSLYPSLSRIQRNLDAITSAVKQNQRNVSLGVRWDFSHHKALKFQCDLIHTDPHSGSIHTIVMRNFTRSSTRKWCSATLDWVF